MTSRASHPTTWHPFHRRPPIEGAVSSVLHHGLQNPASQLLTLKSAYLSPGENYACEIGKVKPRGYQKQLIKQIGLFVIC